MNPDVLKETEAPLGLSIGQVDNRQTIADRMEALAIELRTITDDAVQTVPSQATLLGLAGKIYQARRRVDVIFGIQGFAVSPAWDMVLDLYKAKLHDRSISVTSACIGAACPATTGLRWLHVLEDRHLVARKPDIHDKRRTVVELTEAGQIRVEKALAEHL